MEGCCCAELHHALQYWSWVDEFAIKLPQAGFALLGDAGALLLAVLTWGGSSIKAVVGLALTIIVWPLSLLLWILTSNATLILLATAFIVVWQVYYPARWTLMLISRLPYFQGILIEFPPPANAVEGSSSPPKPYVALTFNSSPCKSNTEQVLDLLAQHDARATFFISGSLVAKLDVLGAGNGHHELGRATLRRMVAQGHELGNQTWHTRPSFTLTPKQLTQELLDNHKLLSSIRQMALAADGDDALWQQALQAQHRKWFRPAGGWVTPAMVEAAEKLGYATVLGSVFPWDTVKLPFQPLLSALYIWSKVYSGAVIVLNDRRQELLPTLQYVLPWLKFWGYDICTLGEAATISSSGQSVLTFDTLQAHTLGVQGSFAPKVLQQQAAGTAQYGSYADLQGVDDQASVRSASEKASVTVSMARQASVGSVMQLEGITENAEKLKMSAAYMAQMAKERERAALIAAAEEAERARIKAAKRAEADRKAGIDRRLVDMSAAEKRAIERREREKKEAEKRRARRKVEEARAKERYEAYVKQKAQEEIARREAEAAAAIKQQEDDERRQRAQEEYRKRQEAERAAAAEMRARLKQEEQEAAADKAAAAASAAAGGSIGISAVVDDVQLARDSCSVAGSVSGDKKKSKLPGLFRKLGDKLSSKKGSSNSSSRSAGNRAPEGSSAAAAAGFTAAGGLAAAGAMAAGAAAEPAAAPAPPPAAGAASAVTPDTSIRGGAAYSTAGATGSSHSSSVHMPAAASSCGGMAGVAYGWYGQAAGIDSLATLASIDAALAQQKAAIAEAAEAAAATSGAQLAQQLGGSWVEQTVAAIAAYEASLPAPAVGRHARSPTGRVLLGFDAQPLLLCDGPEGQAVVLDSQGQALSGPNGEQLALLLGAMGSPLVDPIGRPVMVALQPGSGKPLGVHPDGSIVMVPAARGALAGAAASADGCSFGPAAAAAVRTCPAGLQTVQGSDATGSSSIKEAGSYAPSLARSSSTSHMSVAAGAGNGDGAAAAGASSSAAPGSAAAAAAAGPSQMVPAELLLGPNSKPLLGVDNRPLIVAVDEEGLPLVQSSEGVLLGPDDRPLVLAMASDGSLVALDNQCRPLAGPDGRPRVVALNPQGRPLVDNETGRPVLLTLGPNGLPLSESRSHRVSWAGSASGARLSHSGTQSNLLLAAQPGTGLEVMVGTGEEEVEVVDAADYGQYSAASLGIVAGASACGSDRQLSFSHERAVQQQLLSVGEDGGQDQQQQKQQQELAGASMPLAAAVNEAWLPASMVDTSCGLDQAAGKLAAGAPAGAQACQQSVPQSSQQQMLLVSGILAAEGKTVGLLCEQQLVALTASGTFELTAAAAASSCSG